MTESGKAHPKVIYAGPMSGTCLSRWNALKSIERDAAGFDVDAYFNGSTVFKSIDDKLFQWGTNYTRANSDFLQACESFKPDIAWIDKAFWLRPETIVRLRTMGIFLVQHNTDALYPRLFFKRRSYRLLREALNGFHLYFTSNIDDFRRLSGIQEKDGLPKSPRCELTYLGFDHERFTNSEPPSDARHKWTTDLLFVGHYEPRTERGILALLENGLKVQVHGHGWSRSRNRSKLGHTVSYKELNDLEYVNALKCAKIGLCFFSEWNHNQTSGRSFEIPACGTFLLAMRSEQHLECFREGVDAEFFGSHDELVEKAKFYLSDDNRRREIARNGYQRCVTSDYSWARYMRDDWKKSLNYYGQFKANVAKKSTP